MGPTGSATISLALPAALSCLPVATMSSMLDGASGARSVFRNSTMLFIVNGTP